MEHPLPDFHPELGMANAKKPGLLAETGLLIQLMDRISRAYASGS
jgi:hypothetical protein